MLTCVRVCARNAKKKEKNEKSLLLVLHQDESLFFFFWNRASCVLGLSFCQVWRKIQALTFFVDSTCPYLEGLGLAPPKSLWGLIKQTDHKPGSPFQIPFFCNTYLRPSHRGSCKFVLRCRASDRLGVRNVYASRISLGSSTVYFWKVPNSLDNRLRPIMWLLYQVKTVGRSQGISHRWWLVINHQHLRHAALNAFKAGLRASSGGPDESAKTLSYQQSNSCQVSISTEYKGPKFLVLF